MSYEQLGHEVEGLTREALEVIVDARREGDIVVTQEENPFVRGGKSPTTPADLRAQRVYTDAFAALTPSYPVVAEEKDPNRRPTWVVDGIDGTTRFVDNAPFGYGTQCALIEDGKVPIAYVGDATTGEIFGYHGDSGVFRINKDGQRTLISDVARPTPLREHAGMRRPTIDLYHPLSQRLLLSGDVGEVQELVGGIGTTMAQLLTDKIGLFALRPHHERPWDAVPAYALCEAADMVFMTPSPSGAGFEEWQPPYLDTTYLRTFDLLVMHRTRVEEFMGAVALHASSNGQ
jgi:fructose-1,6-bisphosphatase/inositol monophosphatase family enzyme